MNEVTLNINAV